MRKSSAAPYAIACAIVITLFALFELVRPYYFFQDDNRDIFLPFFAHNYRALADGQLAQFNFFQSLGKPHLATGQTAVFHPINYLALFLSDVVFGDFFAGIDIFVLLHLLLGACGTIYLVRFLGYSSAAAVFAAVAWCFLPFNMLTAQSWSTYPPVIGFLPWIVTSCLQIYAGNVRRGGILFVVAHIGLFYAGAPQFFLYAAMIEAAILLWVGVADFRSKTKTAREIVRRLGVYALLTAFVTALSMPLLLPMWSHMQVSEFRGTELSYGALAACAIPVPHLLNGLFAPFIDYYEPRGDVWCERQFPISFVHQGWIATLLVVAYVFVRKRLPQEQRRFSDAIFATGVVLLVASLGALTPIAASVPVVNRFRWPFKYYGFANLLLMVMTAPALDALLARVSKKMIAAAALVGLQTANVATTDLTFPRQAFFEHLDPMPLREPLKPLFASSRSVAAGCVYGDRFPTVASMGFDYATLWELHYFGGYDPLVPSANFRLSLRLDYQAALCGGPDIIPLDYLRFWGVRHYLVRRAFAATYEPVLTQRGLRRVHVDAERVVMEDARALPLAGSGDCAQRALGRIGDDLTATVDCRTDSTVTLRFLYNPFFSATVDGAPAEIAESEANQVLVRVPRGTHVIQLAYDDPLIDAGLWIAAFALVIAGAAWVLRR